jgi:DNA-binding response OmpR family regulator
MKTILVVDDEVKIIEMVQAYLERAGFQVLCAENGLDAQRSLFQNPVSLVLLDLMLPDLSGEEICKRIRSGFYEGISPDIPLIMITAKADEGSIIRGLRMGADDYVTKPFSPRELVARVQAILRRSGQGPPRGSTPLALGDLRIDSENRRVTRKGTGIPLTTNEYLILELLASRPHKIFTREEIIREIREDDFDGFDRAIDNHIKNLRQKLGDHPRSPRYIETVYGMGYRAL